MYIYIFFLVFTICSLYTSIYPMLAGPSEEIALLVLQEQIAFYKILKNTKQKKKMRKKTTMPMSNYLPVITKKIEQEKSGDNDPCTIQ